MPIESFGRSGQLGVGEGSWQLVDLDLGPRRTGGSTSTREGRATARRKDEDRLRLLSLLTDLHERYA